MQTIINIALVMVLFIVCYLFIREFRIKNFRKTCKAGMKCSFYISEWELLGKGEKFQTRQEGWIARRTKGQVTIKYIFHDKELTRHIEEIYP